jgi:hypothetical protein
MKRCAFTYHSPVQLPTLGQDWTPGQAKDLDDAVAALLPADLFDITDAPAQPQPQTPASQAPVSAAPGVPGALDPGQPAPPAPPAPPASGAPDPLPASTVALPGIGALPVAEPAHEAESSATPATATTSPS